MIKSTLHILANPFGITNTRYRMEPFNVAVLKFIENMHYMELVLNNKFYNIYSKKQF